MKRLPALSSLLLPSAAATRCIAFDGAQPVLLGDWRARVQALAAVLAQRPEARWLLIHDNTLHFATGLFALLHSGKQVVLPPNAQPGTLADLAAEADALLGEGTGPLPALAIDGHAAATTALLPFDSHAATLTVLTSGSTGAPKRIRKPLACFEAEIAVLEAQWGQRLGEAHVLATVSHQHIYGLLFRLLWPLAAGRAFCATTFQFPEPLYAALQAAPCAVLVSSPSQLKRFPAALDLAAVATQTRAVFSSGGPLPHEAALDWAARLGQAPIEVLGSSETGGVAWRQQTAGRQQTAPTDDTPWQAFAPVQLSLDATGCLAVQSPFTGLATPFVMGDRARLLGDGRFVLLGRADTLVKVEEKRVSLTAMEQDLLRSPWVAEARVVPLPDNANRLGAVVVPSPAGQAALARDGRRAVGEALRTHLLAHVERVLLPRKWRFVDALPQDAQGKTRLADLQALFTADGTPWMQLLHDSHDERRLQVIPQPAHFTGHFPGLPILPGVQQFDWAVRACAPWHDLRRFSGIRKLKFSAPVLPGQVLTLQLQRQPDGSVQFHYTCEGRPLSSGTIVFGGGA